MALDTIRTHYPSLDATSLKSDAGGENNAIGVLELIRTTDRPKMTRLIARKDISFSNSPIEAVNKIFKRYLRHGKPQNERVFQKVLSDFIMDYTNRRPHGSLKGLTPFEAYTGVQMSKKPEMLMKNARMTRTNENLRANHAGCACNSA